MDFPEKLCLLCNKPGNGSGSEHITTEKIDSERVGAAFAPKFDAHGLLTAMVVKAEGGAPVMLAHMNREALDLTRETNFAHFYSRSRDTLWKKGETSGNTLRVIEILVDCDQDALVLRVEPAGPACHTGEPSCFYRVLDDGHLEPAD